MECKFREEMEGTWGVIVFYRWISILLAPMLVIMSVTPFMVTIATLFITLLQPLGILFDPPASFIFLGIMGYLFNVFDCLDGDIARLSGTTSRLGQYSDFQVDVIYRMTAYLTFGLLVQQSGNTLSAIQANALLIMSISCLLAISARLSRFYVAISFANEEENAPTDQDLPTLKKIEKIIYSLLSGLDFLFPVLILLAVYVDSFTWLLVWILIYSTIDFLHTQYTNLQSIR